jgi:hypothetical protein
MNDNLKEIYVWLSHMNAYKHGVVGEIFHSSGEDSYD